MNHATTEVTNAYRQRLAGTVAEHHFRESQGLWMSSIGLGSYLGEADARADAGYKAAVKRTFELGCNVFDTAANYRFGRSEQNFGDAFAELRAEGKLSRGEIIVTTKGGYLPFENGMPRSSGEYEAYLESTFLQPG